MSASAVAATRAVAAVRAASAAVLIVAAIAGCGTAAADLFVVTRTPVPGGGADQYRPLTLVVHDDGTVSCSGRRRPLADPLLLQARQLQRDLRQPASRGTGLAPGPRPVYAYSAQTPAGRLHFDDDSPGQPFAFRQLTLFTAQVLRRACGAARARQG